MVHAVWHDEDFIPVGMVDVCPVRLADDGFYIKLIENTAFIMTQTVVFHLEKRLCENACYLSATFHSHREYVLIVNGLRDIDFMKIWRYTQQLSEKHVGFMEFDELVYLVFCLRAVEISALYRQTEKIRPENVKQNSHLRKVDEVYRAAIRLHRLKSGLLVDFLVIVQGAENDLVVLRELLDLVVSPQLVAFLKRPRDSW